MTTRRWSCAKTLGIPSSNETFRSSGEKGQIRVVRAGSVSSERRVRLREELTHAQALEAGIAEVREHQVAEGNAESSAGECRVGEIDIECQGDNLTAELSRRACNGIDHDWRRAGQAGPLLPNRSGLPTPL